MAGVQLASANMLRPSFAVMENLGFEYPSNNSMYLGEWRNQISARLLPSYFNNLLNANSHNYKVNNFARHMFGESYSTERFRFVTPVFSDNLLVSLADDTNLFFSFATDHYQTNAFAFNQMLLDFGSVVNSTKSSSLSKLIDQKYFTPGYTLAHGNSSFGVAAVLVQQRFLDDTYGSVTYASSSTYQPYNDSALININRGTGYRLNFTQSLPANVNISVDYHSSVEMNEFDSFGSTYSEPGDFDIPSQYTLSLVMPISTSDKINLTAEKISYSSSNTVVHSGYSQSFLNVFNSPVSPVFRLDDLTIYSMGYERNINESFSWNFDITSRQQAPATAIIYDNILKNDTAAVSYKVGFSHTLAIGKLDVFTSFANKPILIGLTEFGRISSNSLNRHIEGVATWSFQF